MRVIARSTLVRFWEKHSSSKESLQAWFSEAQSANWSTPQDIKNRYSSVDFLENNRVVFNIKGNHYRLIAQIQYQAKIVWIKFVGTHAEYDKVNAATVDMSKGV